MLRRAFRRASARCSAHGGAAVGMRSGCPPHAHECNVLNKGDAETPKNGFRTPPINYRNSSPRCLHTRLNAKFGKSPQSTKFSRRKLREPSLIYARAPRESCCRHRRAEKRTPCRCTKKTAQERIPCAEKKWVGTKDLGKISESEAKVGTFTQSDKFFCRKTPDRSRTRASRARPRLNNCRTEGALSPIASAISAELHPSACSSTTLRDSVPKAESARDHRASSTRA